ncbi:MAG: ABC transporter ATP-binding protein [Ilumatobacteraceae bacterium]
MSGAQNVSLSLQGVSISFGGAAVVKDTSFDIGIDELTALVGPNGAGKTALLNAICGIYKISSGSISLFGERIDGHRASEVAVRGIGRSFQHAEIFPKLSVLDNLLAAEHKHLHSNSVTQGIFYGKYRRREVEARGRVEQVVDFFELEKYRKQPAGGLSFGLQKLVGVARAVCTRPKVLLLDEPSSGLTREEKEDFARFLLRLRFDMKIPILWVEHDMQMVTDLADRIIALDYGLKIAEGTPAEIIKNPEVIAAYLGIADTEPVG